MEILMFDYCFKKFQNSFKKQRGASTFECNAKRLLLIVTPGASTVTNKQNIDFKTDSRKTRDL